MFNLTSTPVHPLTGERLEPIGINPRTGELRWPIMGAAEDDDADKDAGGDDGGDDADKDAGGDDGADAGDDDGDGDKDTDLAAQLAAQRRINKQLERRTKKDLARIKELEGTSPKDKKADDDAPDVDKIREEARAEARLEGLKDRAEDKIELKAAKKFADPEDAVAILMRENDIEDFLADGKVDVEAIQEALDDLLDRKPHLAAGSSDDDETAQGGRKKKYGGSADGGARKGSSKPAQLTKADVERLAKEGKHQEIEKARLDGRLKDLLSGK